MRITRLAGLFVAAVVAISLLPVASASAEINNQLFVPANNQSITGKSGVSILRANAGEVVECQKDNATGTVTSSLLAGNVFVHYLECVAKEFATAKTTCTIKSVGAPAEGLILTNTLHGILGLILPSGETGILFLPGSGKIFLTLAESTNAGTRCTVETKVSGNVIGLVTPVGKKQLTGEIIFPSTAIKTIDLTHKLGFVESELASFSSASFLQQTENVEFSEATEVT